MYSCLCCLVSVNSFKRQDRLLFNSTFGAIHVKNRDLFPFYEKNFTSYCDLKLALFYCASADWAVAIKDSLPTISSTLYAHIKPLGYMSLNGGGSGPGNGPSQIGFTVYQPLKRSRVRGFITWASVSKTDPLLGQKYAHIWRVSLPRKHGSLLYLWGRRYGSHNVARQRPDCFSYRIIVQFID